MMSPPDLATPKALELLSCVEETLSKYQAPVCRSFLAPGGSPSWDTCCDCGRGEGMAWVQIVSVGPTEAFPGIFQGAMRQPPPEFVLEMNVGILRCAAVLDDQGRAPSSEKMTADGMKVQRDRAIVAEAIRCCFLEQADPGTFSIGSWTPLGPQGGCVGGTTSIRIAASACRCPEDEYDV